MRNLAESPKCDIAFPSFDPAYVAPVQITPVGKLFLVPTTFRPCAPNPLPENHKIIVRIFMHASKLRLCRLFVHRL